jgi:hypothetical protein
MLIQLMALSVTRKYSADVVETAEKVSHYTANATSVNLNYSGTSGDRAGHIWK